MANTPISADPRLPGATISGASPSPDTKSQSPVSAPASVAPTSADLKTLATGINDALRSMTGHALHIVQSAMQVSA
jgi:hypothetical protein